MTTTVCLVRHGETEWNRRRKLQGREDIELNQNGIKQAILCGGFLKRMTWDVIITSPLTRAMTTAQIISRYTGIEQVLVINGFIERDYGKASGLTPEERKNVCREGMIDGQEDWNNLRDRVMKALQSMVDYYLGKRIIIVSHGGVINCILSEISHGEIGTGKTVLKNGCISVLKNTDGKWNIETYNQTVY